jgi:tetratricopeptide (TPR) repeat protein
MNETTTLPAPAHTQATPRNASRSRWPDALLAALVLAFAFLASSFAARNSDLWLHLATGRLLASGECDFGADPFAYTTSGVYWANHAWLFDLGLYAGLQTLGGAGLVALKALAVAALAGLMLRLASAGGSACRGPFWVAAGCCLLALLAMSPRLLLQPACASLLLLALCLQLLRAGGRALYWLPAVVALWVNLDAWFLLGPLLVALVWTGQRLAPGAQRLPFWLLPACLAACLLSPHHVRALTPPAELSWAVWHSDFRHDPRFAPLFASPWSLETLGSAGGFSLAAWAYLLLLALGVLSFAVNRQGLRDWRLPTWLAFALLGAWQARLVPFFAVVAGPITALNFREQLPALALLRTGRAGVLLAGLGLLALSYPGWLQGFHRRDRPLAWDVHADPSLRRVAATLADWRQQGTLPPEARTFATHPDVSHYCAWFCPGEKVFLDSRLPLFLHVAADYRRICSALALPALDQERRIGGRSEEGWGDALAQRDVRCLILYDPDLQRMTPALAEAAQTPQRWRLLRVDGQAVLVGWQGGPDALPAAPTFDAEREAFQPGASTLPPAATDEPGPLALSETPWWSPELRTQPSGSSWQADAAAVYVRLFQASAGQRWEERVAVHAAGLLVLPASPPPGSSAGSCLGVPVRLAAEGMFLWDLSERSPALPLLAVRAARSAVAAHPDDGKAWLVLAQAYLALGRGTTEYHAGLPPLAAVRQAQTAAALVQAVTCQPSLATAHEALALLYVEARYLDLALRHRNAQLRLTRRAGRLSGESQAAFDSRLEQLKQVAEQLESVVQDSENRYFVRTQSLAADPLARARTALQLGLGGKALEDVLLRSSPDLYKAEGLRLLLELLLSTGRAQEVRVLLDREEMRRNPDGLGVQELVGNQQEGAPHWRYRFHAYDWFDLCQSAAAGRHDGAGRAVERLRERQRLFGEQLTDRLTREVAGRLTTEVGLGAVPGALALRYEARGERDRAVGLFGQNRFLLVVRADLLVLEGMLLLERGLPGEARETFRRSLPLYRQAADTAPALPGQPLALRYLSRLRD